MSKVKGPGLLLGVKGNKGLAHLQTIPDETRSNLPHSPTPVYYANSQCCAMDWLYENNYKDKIIIKKAILMIWFKDNGLRLVQASKLYP